MPLALVLLATTAPWMAGGAAFAILFGLGSGPSSIVSGTLPLALFGAGRHGRRLGLISSARLVVSSFAPVVFAVVAGLLSTQVALWLVVLTGLLGSACFVALWLRFDRQAAALQPAAQPWRRGVFAPRPELSMIGRSGAAARLTLEYAHTYICIMMQLSTFQTVGRPDAVSHRRSAGRR